jgi:competence protein ComEA
VRKAGVYILPSGSRVVDAIAQAGGAAENADLEQLNLAEPLADAMKVDVPVKGQQLAVPAGIAYSASSTGTQDASAPRSGRHRSSRSGSHKLAAGQTIDINTASESELTQLPGVGPSLARRIVEYRTANGPFQLPDDLQNVSGIGANKFAKMEPFIRL